MPASQILALTLVSALVLVALMYLLNRGISRSEIFNPPEMELKDYFNYEPPNLEYWLIKLHKHIKIIQFAIKMTQERIREIEALPSVELNLWDKTCELCHRMVHKLWVAALVVVDGLVVIWLFFVIASAGSLLKYHAPYDTVQIKELVVPESQGNLHLALLISGVGLGILVLLLAAFILGKLNRPRLKEYRELRVAKREELPILLDRLRNLQELNIEKQDQLEESLTTHDWYFPA